MQIQDQPPPVPTEHPAVWGLVIQDVLATQSGPLTSIVVADMQERDRLGRERYGVPLQAHNGRDALVDAYQEALDLCAYLRQAIAEKQPHAATLYTDAVRMAFAIRGLINARGAL